MDEDEETYESVVRDEEGDGVVGGVEQRERSVVRLVDELVVRYPSRRQPVGRQVAVEALLQGEPPAAPVEQLVHVPAFVNRHSLLDESTTSFPLSFFQHAQQSLLLYSFLTDILGNSTFHVDP